MEKFYSLPELGYDYSALEPEMSGEQLELHHDMHHKAYVDNANAILKKLDEAGNKGGDLDLKAIAKELSFNVGGHILHSLFWDNLISPKEFEEPSDALKKEIEDNFGSFENFRAEFSKVALSTEGSGWAALTYCKKTGRFILMQIEKHNVNVIPMFSILLVLDVWEHAYYLDYKNKRPAFIEAFWNIVNWKEVEKRLKEAKA